LDAQGKTPCLYAQAQPNKRSRNMMQGGRNLNIYKRRSIYTTCGSPKTSFHQFKRQLRGMERHKLQFTTWKLLLEHIEVLVLTKKTMKIKLV